MHKHIQPIAFSAGPYGQNCRNIWRRVIDIDGADSTKTDIYSSNILKTSARVHDVISIPDLPDTQPKKAHYLDMAIELQKDCKRQFQWFAPGEPTVVWGGDHSISMGTAAGISDKVNLEEVGIIWVDSHADFNTAEVSESKSLTGYPAAVCCGLGLDELVKPIGDKFVKNIVHIGTRDIDSYEKDLLDSFDGSAVYSAMDVDRFGISGVMKKALEKLAHCKWIWLSIDVDVLDPIYFAKGETDLPVFAGLTPRELLYIVEEAQRSNKLLLTEIVQLNDIGVDTPLAVLGSRITELALGLGGFRY